MYARKGACRPQIATVATPEPELLREVVREGRSEEGLERNKERIISVSF